MGVRSPLIAVASCLLALGSGCISAETLKDSVKKPDVTQPGVLPPPQETARPASTVAPSGPIIQASATQPVSSGLAALPGLSLAKLTGKFDKRMAPSEIALGWQSRIAYLPDPSRHGAMGCGLVGQMFLYGGPNLEFMEANGTLTVDLIDETPRPGGQPGATPERWQFKKEVLKNLKAIDETFGKSYVLFLPWPAYKPDITRVRIAARFDPDHGTPLYVRPTTITIDPTAPLGAPVWKDHRSTIVTPTAGGSAQPGGMLPAPHGMMPAPAGFPAGGMMPTPMPLGGSGMNPGLPPIAITAGRP